MLQPNEITRLRQQWPAEEPSSDLADRIIAHALAHKQQRPWLARLQATLTNPSPAFAMRGIAVAACLTLAIVALDGGSTGSKPKTTTAKYKMPMEQIVEDLIWNDYNY